MKLNVRTWEALAKPDRRKILLRSESDITSVRDHVQTIIDRVRREGDAALRALTKEYDRADVDRLPLRVEKAEFAKAREALRPEVREALRFAIDNVTAFHRPQLRTGIDLHEIRPGIFAGERATAIDSVGLYVPRGRGSFPSMLYMLAVPAKIAGVRRVCVVTPPGPDGSVDAACLYAAELCEVDEVYRAGGAQAIAALAYGTESIEAVAKIVSPGSSYVSAAKRLVASQVDVGLPAGPSESIVLADESPNPHTVALDLLIEAEHGSDSSALLITPSTELAQAVASLLPGLVERIPEPRRSFVADVLSGYGGILLTRDMETAISVVNEFAPEHLQIRTREPFATLQAIRNAGEILLGEHTPFSAANYAIGANAVLPTGGRARTWSPVSVRDFVKYSSVVYATRAGYEALAPHVVALADYEGFFTHAEAVRQRKGSQ